jgi:hypothetical protein
VDTPERRAPLHGAVLHPEDFLGLLPRFAVLPLAPDGRNPCYVIYDRLTQRITNGVYFVLDLALANAANAEERGADVADMTPNAEALGLLFPQQRSKARTAART